jgi:excisionase family DNA binding protein
VSGFDVALIEALVRLIDARIGAALAAYAERADTAEQPSEYLSVEECAHVLRTSRQRIYDLCSSGRLCRTKDGARTLIRRADLDAYLQNGGDRRRRR